MNKVKTTTEPEYAASVGIDWADRSHRVCLRTATGHQDEQHDLEHKPDALRNWALQLRTRFGGRKIAVALEQSRGPLIYALQAFAHLELFPINPATLAKYRAAATAASGAKSDPLDAGLACELVRLHRDWLRRLEILSPDVRQLQLLCEARRGWVEQRTAFEQQLIDALKGYFPLALDLVGDVGGQMCGELLRRWPSLAALRRVKPDTLRCFFRHHHVHPTGEIERRLSAIRSAVALTDDPAIVSALSLQATALVAQLAVVRATIANYDQSIADLFARQVDAPLFASLPGAGAQFAPRLYVAFGDDRRRYDNAAQIQRYSGVAPVKKKSGESLNRVEWRWHCPTFLRQTFVEYAGASIPHSVWAKAFYRQLIARGKTRQKALRALAYKWQRIIFRCWRTRQPYNEQRYLAALRERGSPLIGYIDDLNHALP
jgi:transposase